MKRTEAVKDEPDPAKTTGSAKRPRTSLEKWLTLVTAIMSLATAGLGVAAAQINFEKNKAQASAESRGADLSTAQDENDRLKKQSNELAAENSSLRSQPPASSPGEPPPNAQSKLLSEMQPLNTNSVNSPRPVTIGAHTYPNSFTLGCSTAGTSVTYAVAGYSALKARTGLDDNEAGTAAKANYSSIIRVTADNGRQLGTEVKISLSAPADLSVPLEGAVQATIKCTLIDPRGGTTGYYRAAFGDAVITK